MDALELLNKHCEFKEPTDCYVIIAVSRKKDTQDITNSTEIVFRDVIKSKGEIVKKYLKMKGCITNYRDENNREFPFYLYIQLNPGNARRAAIELLKRITSWIEREHYKDAQVNDHYKRTSSEFFSCLMIPECRGSKKYFMIDYDSKDGLEDFTRELEKHTQIILIQPTRHGFHIKCNPFDKRKLELVILNGVPFEVKKDSLLFVEFFENERTEKVVDLVRHHLEDKSPLRKYDRMSKTIIN
jgi:hypothetical protein